MHPLTLVLAVPLFCSFGVSLPYQDFESNAPALPISDDESKWDADSADYSDLFSGEKLQALLPLSTGSGASSFLESLPGLPGVDFAAKPSVPPKAGSTAQQRPAPGKLRSRPTTGDTPSRQSSPGTVPQQPNPATNPGLPWTANPSFGGQLPQELQITPEYGYIGPYFTCTLGNIPGNVVSPSHPLLLSAPLSNLIQTDDRCSA